MIVAGVDPGATGAVAIFDTERRTLELIDMPTFVEQQSRGKKKTRVDAMALARIMTLVVGVIDVACVEKVGAMTGQGTSSMFAFGRATGIVEGVLACVSDRLITLRPQQWQPLARVKGGADIKLHARNRAMVLFPNNAHQFKRVKDSGRADAALIAYATAIQLGAIK